MRFDRLKKTGRVIEAIPIGSGDMDIVLWSSDDKKHLELRCMSEALRVVLTVGEFTELLQFLGEKGNP